MLTAPTISILTHSTCYMKKNSTCNKENIVKFCIKVMVNFNFNKFMVARLDKITTTKFCKDNSLVQG